MYVLYARKGKTVVDVQNMRERERNIMNNFAEFYFNIKIELFRRV